MSSNLKRPYLKNTARHRINGNWIYCIAEDNFELLIPVSVLPKKSHYTHVPPHWADSVHGERTHGLVHARPALRTEARLHPLGSVDKQLMYS